jgi:tRNA pseudouridine13 synthase
MVYITSVADALPYLTEGIAPIPGRFATFLEDFEVEEVPAYEPSGEGEHVFVFLEKRDLTTPEAVARVCRAIGADRRTVGWAGMKDRKGVTRQWISVWGVTPEAVLACQLDGIRLLRAARHNHKLRTGHLRGNRFVLRLREVATDRMDDLAQVLRKTERRGFPNYFGMQRFGRDGDNADRGLKWLLGHAPPPRGRFDRKLLVSSVQSALFNISVAERVHEGTLGHVFEGDVMQRHDTGGLFVADDAPEAQARADLWEISPTGPMFGTEMRWPENVARLREEALLASSGLTPSHLAGFKRYGPGTRRMVRARPADLHVQRIADDVVELKFALPPGSYATMLVREILKRDADAPKTS